MSEIIKGQVAKILNSRELVINKGRNDGVYEDTIFTVYDKKGENIKDPATDELLGSVKRPKVDVKVTHVEEKLCIASTFRSKKINVGGSASADLLGIARRFQPPQYKEVYDSLKTDEQTWEDLDEQGSFVKTGDPVEQVKERPKPKAPTVKP